MLNKLSDDAFFPNVDVLIFTVCYISLYLVKYLNSKDTDKVCIMEEIVHDSTQNWGDTKQQSEFLT